MGGLHDIPLLALFINKKKAIAVVTLILLVAAAYLSIMYLLPRRNPLYRLSLCRII